ncbi:hypothetical protein [Corynebacterium phoceense]|uniref:hypothetical protein n=1 Tax=Corynebacterium phoceense TaxID=1686286 RepID=UPI0018AA76EC|nr:hypothetical protein [Corynebacterium phoceense]MBF9011278.1 hypothetical protein [Corynebacterium phoceense]
MTFSYDEWIAHITEVPEDKLRLLGLEGARERTRREAEDAIRQQRAEDAQALWEEHPELKPAVEETPTEPIAPTVDEAAKQAGIDEFKLPTGSHNSYPKGAKFLYAGRIWEAQIDGYNWPPTAPGIDSRYVLDVTDRYVAQADVPEETPTVDTPKLFVQPTGAHDAYAKGARMSFEGKVYESLLDANAYGPSAYPAGWKQVKANG